ncbi:cornifelin-like [Saccoglossus kowalevskii]|uniref:Cornifelin-like n=1 Tax=Saccoglossus kowalevskii TaxID=10224 RepID=A0ABM0LXR1_SACKO|nr:PREDICTED: cornifelin-like [Saccoglossus kowalevskii]
MTEPLTRQPQPQVVVVQAKTSGRKARNWHIGLLQCCDNKRICLCGAFCYPCLLARTAGKLGEACCLPMMAPCCVGTPLRMKLRMLTTTKGSLLGDCCAFTWCAPCAACQLEKEVRTLNGQGVVLDN